SNQALNVRPAAVSGMETGKAAVGHKNTRARENLRNIRLSWRNFSGSTWFEFSRNHRIMLQFLIPIQRVTLRNAALGPAAHFLEIVRVKIEARLDGRFCQAVLWAKVQESIEIHAGSSVILIRHHDG